MDLRAQHHGIPDRAPPYDSSHEQCLDPAPRRRLNRDFVEPGVVVDLNVYRETVDHDAVPYLRFNVRPPPVALGIEQEFVLSVIDTVV